MLKVNSSHKFSDHLHYKFEKVKQTLISIISGLLCTLLVPRKAHLGPLFFFFFFHKVVISYKFSLCDSLIKHEGPFLHLAITGGNAAFTCYPKFPASNFRNCIYKFVAIKCFVVRNNRNPRGHQDHSCQFLGEVLLNPKYI